MAAVSMLGGVGFTVSLLIAELSLRDQPEVLDAAKAAVLIASAAASLIGAAMLVRRGRVPRDGGRPGEPAPSA
jgi:NhaA family Na+:H+ antiporter